MSSSAAPRRDDDAALTVARRALAAGWLARAALREALLLRHALREAGRAARLAPLLAGRVAPDALAALARLEGDDAAEDETLVDDAVDRAAEARAAALAARPPEEDPPAVRALLAACEDDLPTQGSAQGSASGSAHGSGSGSGAAAAPLPARVGDLEVVAELGRGGMGVVYAARDPALGREVAVKVLHAHGATPDARRRFEVEARAAARLSHPGIVAVHALGVDQATGAPYVVMERVRGESLRDALRGGPLAPAEAARLAEEVARALATAHEAGVLHRDVKPHNVLLDERGAARLVDFGLAKALDAADGLTSTGQVLGTPAYMSPEQADGDGARAGPASDVWSLGATLYEMLTGRPPFCRASVPATLSAVLHADPVAPARLRPGVPRDLETIVLCCLEKDPTRRYASALALAADLARWRGGQAIEARPAGALRRAARAVRRRPIVAAGVVGALAVGVGLWGAERAARPGRAMALLHEARALARRGRDEAALVEQALALGGRTPALLVEAALACEAGGRLERARALLEEAARGDSPEALLELHRLTLRQEPRGSRITPALERLIALALARGEADEFGLFARAERALAAGDAAQAVALLDRVEALGARFPWALVERARAREALGDLDGARADLERALTLDPDLAVARVNRADLRGAAGDLAGARADLDRAVELDPGLAAAWCLRGLVRRRAGDPAGAVGDLRRAVSLAPGLAPAHLALGELRLEAARREDPASERAQASLEAAVVHLDRALELDPGLALAWALRGDAQAARGEPELAYRDYAQALGLDPARKETWLERAILHAALGESHRAEHDLTEALALDPGWAEAYWRRAAARGEQGELEEALRDADNALRLEPRSVDALLTRANLRAFVGDEAGARRDLEAALEALPPDDPRSVGLRAALGR
ncbi:MAG: protein kinase [Planctomycetes bacterium]|nr:protein kinase [Planctomycetota bacterium]